MKLKVKKMQNKTVLYLLFFIAFIRPEYLVRIPTVNTFYGLLRYFLIGVMILLAISRSKGLNISKFTGVWILFELWIVTITILQFGNVTTAVNQAVTITMMALLFEMFTEDMEHILRVLYYFLGILILINFVTLFAFPEGMYVTGVTNTASQNWFLGFKNKHIIYFLPFLGLIFIFGKRDGYTWKKILMLAVTVGSALYCDSSTLIVCLAVMLLVGFLPFVREHYKIFNMYSYFIVAVAMFVLIPVLRLQYLFSYLIVDVLQKNIDLTYRTELWDRAFRAIQQHFFWGWGEQPVDVKHLLYNSQSILSAHNQILEYFYVGGLVLVVLYVIINLMLAKKLNRIKQNEVIQIASGIYLAFQIALIVEVYTDAIIYMLYFILWHIDVIVYQENSYQYEEEELLP